MKILTLFMSLLFVQQVLAAQTIKIERFVCDDDIKKFCTPKNITPEQLSNRTFEQMRGCLEGNKNKISKDCQVYLKQLTYNECREHVYDSCNSLRGDARIECTADIQLSPTDPCAR